MNSAAAFNSEGRYAGFGTSAEPESRLSAENRDLNVGKCQVSVIVPARNAEVDLPLCLRAIYASRVISPEVIVVDDASTDRTWSVAAANGATKVLRLPRRSGPAVARNAGAVVAGGEILFFVDADVLIHPESLQRATSHIRDGGWQAVFGSYDTSPTYPGLVSQYRNLLHHFVHQTSNMEAQTFWAGCGAVRRDVFLEFGGFSEDFPLPSVEDIELGMRLSHAGCRILLAKEIRASHTKRWTLYSTIFTDVFRRGVPWTRLLMASGPLPRDLNLSYTQRINVALTGIAELALLAQTPTTPRLLLTVPLMLLAVFCMDYSSSYGRWRIMRVLSVALILASLAVASSAAALPSGAAVVALFALIGLLNHRVLRFFYRVRGVTFAACCYPLLLIYYNCCGVSFISGWLLHLRSGGAGGYPGKGTVPAIALPHAARSSSAFDVVSQGQNCEAKSGQGSVS